MQLLEAWRLSNEWWGGKKRTIKGFRAGGIGERLRDSEGKPDWSGGRVRGSLIQEGGVKSLDAWRGRGE